MEKLKSLFLMLNHILLIAYNVKAKRNKIKFGRITTLEFIIMLFTSPTMKVHQGPKKWSRIKI